MLGGFATFAQLYTPQAVLPIISRDLGIDTAASALLVSAGTIGIAVGVLPWAWLSDRIGRVAAMRISLSVSAALGLVLPFWPDAIGLISLRLLVGLTLACLPAVAVTYLFEELDARRASVAAGTYIAGTTIGGVSGRIITAPLADLWGWRLGVFGTAVVITVAVVAFMVIVPKPHGFVRTSRGSEPRVWNLVRRHLRDPLLLTLFSFGGLTMGGFVAMYNFLPFHLEAPPFLLPASITGLLFLTYLAGTFSSRAVWRFVPGRGERRVVILALTIFMLGVAATLIPWLPSIVGGLLVMTTGFFAVHSVASASVGAQATVGKAQAASLYNLFYYGGSSLFGWLGGFFFDWLTWVGVVVMVLALALVAMVLALRMPAGSAGRLTGA